MLTHSERCWLHRAHQTLKEKTFQHKVYMCTYMCVYMTCYYKEIVVGMSRNELQQCYH